MGLELLVLNKAQTVVTFARNGVTAILWSLLLKGNAHMVGLFVPMNGLLIATQMPRGTSILQWTASNIMWLQRQEHTCRQLSDRGWTLKRWYWWYRMRGVSRQLFQCHLDHFCWKVMRKNSNDLFVSFFEDVQNVYR